MRTIRSSWTRVIKGNDVTSHLKRGLLLLVGIWAVASVRGGSSTPTAPSSSSGGGSTGQPCRTYPTSATDVVTNPSAVPPFTLTNTYTAVFNPSTNQITVTGNVKASTGCAGPFTAASTWGSLADFVAEVAVIPPLTRATRTERSANACGASATTTTLTYDGQNRLTQLGTTSYTAWDSSGRPTAGTQTGRAGPISWSFSYDNSTRIKTSTSILNGVPTAVSTTFDVNGNVIGISGAGTTSVTTVLSTATVCS